MLGRGNLGGNGSKYCELYTSFAAFVRWPSDSVRASVRAAQRESECGAAADLRAGSGGFDEISMSVDMAPP